MADLRALLEMRQASPLQFSDDGARLLVASNIPGTQQLYDVPSRGGELRQLTDFADPVSGQLLPDGRILLERDEGGNERTGERSADNDLFLIDVEAADVVHATPHDEPAEYYAPVWLSDGSGFLLATNEDRDTFAIARHDVAAGTRAIVHESEWDLEPY